MSRLGISFVYFYFVFIFQVALTVLSIELKSLSTEQVLCFNQVFSGSAYKLASATFFFLYFSLFKYQDAELWQANHQQQKQQKVYRDNFFFLSLLESVVYFFRQFIEAIYFGSSVFFFFGFDCPWKWISVIFFEEKSIRLFIRIKWIGFN